MNHPEKNIWFQILIAGLLLIAIVRANPYEDHASVLIDFGDARRMFEGEVMQGMTVLDALNASVIAGNIPFRFMISRDQTKILTIDGHEDPLGTRPDVYMNGRAVDARVLHRTYINPQDAITVKLP